MVIMVCPRCGATVENGASSCPSCGVRFTPGKYCPHCRAVIPASAGVCPHCGGPQASGLNEPPKKGGFRWWFILLFLLFLLIGFAAGVIVGPMLPLPELPFLHNDGDSPSSVASAVSSSPEESTPASAGSTAVQPTGPVFNIGEPWTVDGQWSLTVTGVEETQERNDFSERTPQAVYKVTYTYTNSGYEDPNGVLGGLFFSMDDTIVDSAGKMAYSYPNTVTSYPQETPVGATCDAEVFIGVDTPGAFTISVSRYDGNGEKQSATFAVAV